MSEDGFDRSAMMAASCLMPLLTELLGALHDEGALTGAQAARVAERWDAALASWEKREGMVATVRIMRSELAAEAAHRLPGVAPPCPEKPTRLTRAGRAAGRAGRD